MRGVVVYKLVDEMEKAEKRLRSELSERGFGVLTEVDVQAVLREKAGVETAPYKILGVCNPQLAHRGLTTCPEAGAFLPCSIALYPDHEGTRAVLMDPGLIPELLANGDLTPVAHEALDRLNAALVAASMPEQTVAEVAG